MSAQGKKTAQNVAKFLEILSKYEVNSVFGHYLNVAVELEKDTVVSEDDKLALNALNGYNDLATNVWQLHYHLG